MRLRSFGSVAVMQSERTLKNRKNRSSAVNIVRSNEWTSSMTTMLSARIWEQAHRYVLEPKEAQELVDGSAEDALCPKGQSE
jgi:hypothetical protein